MKMKLDIFTGNNPSEAVFRGRVQVSTNLLDELKLQIKNLIGEVNTSVYFQPSEGEDKTWGSFIKERK